MTTPNPTSPRPDAYWLADTTDHDNPASPAGMDPTLAGRLKALALTAPLHDLDTRKTMQQLDWDVYQMTELALVTIDQISAAMDFDTGAVPADIESGVARHAAIQAPDRDADEHRKVADWVLQNLLNVGSSDRGFSVRYGTTGPDGYVRREFHFKLLVETLGADGDTYLRATTEAINVLIGALDLDIAAAHTAADLRLENLIRSGRLREASGVAREAKLRTIQFGEQLRQQLEAANRDIRNVDWIDAVPTLIHNAMDHIDERSKFEGAIQLNLIEMRDTADDTASRRSAAELATEMGDCLRRQAHLAAALQRAGAIFRAEQDRQTFTAATSTVTLDLHAQLLLPTLRLTIGEAVDPLTGLFSYGAGVTRELRALHLADLFDNLITPTTAADPFGAEQPEPDLSGDEDPERFPERAYRALTELLSLDADAPQRLSGLLAAARVKTAEDRAASAGVNDPDGEDPGHDGEPADPSDDLAELPLLLVVRVVARATEGIGPARKDNLTSVLIAVDDGTALDDPLFAGADLLVGRADLLYGTAGNTPPDRPHDSAVEQEQATS